MTYSISIFVVVLVLCMLHTIGRCDFESDDIDDSFSLRAGSAGECPRKIEFDGKFSETTITSGEIEVNDIECANGGEIKVSENADVNNATKYLLANQNDAGDFLAGSVTDDIECFPSTLFKNEVVIFMKPDDTISIRYDTLFNKSGTAVEAAAKDSEFTFNEDAKYVILGERCIFEETRLRDRVCFPATAMVSLASGRTKQMAFLSTDDTVVVDEHGKTERVLGFSHQDTNVRALFYTLHLHNGAQFTASHGHYIPVWLANNKNKEMKRMEDVRTGMYVWHVHNGLVNVSSITQSKRRGVWNPHTKSGTIVVDGVLASCYTKATTTAVTGHALLAPLRNEMVARMLNSLLSLFSS